MTPSEFWNLTIQEWWWWFDTVIPEELIEKRELSDKLKRAKERELNGQ